MKKISVCVLLLLLFVSILPSLAQDTPVVFSSGEWDYVENNAGITLTVYRGNETHLEIPSELDGKTVSQLGKDLFLNNMSLESVVIPDTVTQMGANLFNGCAALKDVVLPKKITSLPTGAFRYCISLEHITIPFTVTSIGAFAFSDCIQLQDIMLLSVTSVGESAFDNCMQLSDVIVSGKLISVNGRAFRDTPWLDAQTDEFVFMGKDVLVKYNGTAAEVEIPYGTTMISNAFEENYSVESVYIPETVTTIGQYAFMNALNLTRVNIPEFITSIQVSAFNGCRNLTEIQFPYDLKTLADNSFRGCESLQSVIIPGGVTTLGSNVFGSCPSLTDVMIPASVTKIHNNTFQNSPNVHLHITQGSEGERFAQELEISYDYTMQLADEFIYSLEGEEARIVRYLGRQPIVEVPAEYNGALVTAIGEGAFQNNKRVSQVILPLTVRSIGDWAFSYMGKLEYVELSINLNEIGSNVFTGSANLKEIKLPETLTVIGEAPFDSDTAAVICAAPGSSAAAALQEMGYTTSAYDACSSDDEALVMLSEDAETVIVDAAVCEGDDCGESTEVQSDDPGQDVTIIRIPDGIQNLTADLIPQNASDLVLVIPVSVTSIEPAILSGRTLTIVSDSGSAAEEFARQNGIKFILRINTWLGE